MNDRIQELAEQARFQWTKFGFVTTPESNPEKFAKLLILECIHTVEHHGGMGGATSGQRLRDRFDING